MLIKQDYICTPVGKNRTLHIYLPDGYYDTAERYPVMYFFDGHNLFRDADATYGKCWGLESFLSQWDKPMIIVGIECGHEGRERLNEYSPYYWNSNYIGKVEGIGDTILEWMVKELKPMIDSQYRTFYFREATAIGGSSMGGLMALYGVVKFNRYFSKAACLSPTIIPCYRKLSSDLKKAKLYEDTRIWMSYGEEEALGHDKLLREVLETKTVKYLNAFMKIFEEDRVIARTYIQPQGRHCEADWEKQVPAFMDFLWK